MFAGTTEGRVLAERLAGAGMNVAVCVATDYGREMLAGLPENVRVLTGRKDADAMVRLMREEAVGRVVDATHPYAVVVSENIRNAAAAAGLPYLRLRRSASAGDGCVFVDSIEAAAARLAGTDGNVLLATGAKELDRYTVVPGYAGRMYPRVLPSEESIRRCRELGFAPGHIIAMQGPFGVELNRALMKQFRIRFMVTKDGGREGGFPEKMLAAEEEGVAVLVVGRPPEMDGLELEAVVGLLCGRGGKE